MTAKPDNESCPLPGSKGNPNPDAITDDDVRELLTSIRTIAVVGMSSKPHRPSRGVGLYLKKQGYTIIPVHPREKSIDGMRVYPDLESIRGEEASIDLVDLFVSGEKTAPVVEQAACIGARAVWFQPGAEYPPAQDRARELGLVVVSGRCTMADHSRLLGNR
jgi:predicted CoA-binding protein